MKRTPLLIDSHFSTLHVWLSYSRNFVIWHNSDDKSLLHSNSFQLGSGEITTTNMRQTAAFWLTAAITFRSLTCGAPQSSCFNNEEVRLQEFLAVSEEQLRNASETMSFISWNYAININNETEKNKVDFQVCSSTLVGNLLRYQHTFIFFKLYTLIHWSKLLRQFFKNNFKSKRIILFNSFNYEHFNRSSNR